MKVAKVLLKFPHKTKGRT